MEDEERPRETFAEWLRARSKRGRHFAIRTALAVFEELGWRRRTLRPVTLVHGAERFQIPPRKTITVGRGPDNDLVLADDKKASSRHFQARVDEFGFLRVKDLGSTNGTYRNGSLVYGEPVALAGDELQAGMTLLRVVDPVSDFDFLPLDLLAAWADAPNGPYERAIEEFLAILRVWIDGAEAGLDARRRALAVASTVLGVLAEPPTIEGLSIVPGPSERLRIDVTGGEDRSLPAAAIVTSTPRKIELSLGDFAILGAVGQGWWGVLHWAHDRKRGRPVLLEELPEPARERIKSFRERWPVVELEHPYLERVLDVRDEGVIVRELVRGRDIHAWLESDPTREERVAVAFALVMALEHAHGRALVHGDIHPKRILIDDDTGEPVLGGFGRSFLLGQAASEASVELDRRALETEIASFIDYIPLDPPAPPPTESASGAIEDSPPEPAPETAKRLL